MEFQILQSNHIKSIKPPLGSDDMKCWELFLFYEIDCDVSIISLDLSW